MSIKIIITEDEPLISADLSGIVSAEGYQVVGTAFDGSTALELIHSRQPDIVLLDIGLHGQLTGLDVAGQINKRFGIPFIFITSYSDRETLQIAKSLLPEGYIVKPFKKKDILATLEIVSFRVQHQKLKGNFRSLEEVNATMSDKITQKEYEILLDVTNGLTNDMIAEKCFISVNTVKTHLKRVFAKLDISSRNKIPGIIYRNH
jgi:two-component system, response regulator PdtaR